MNKSLILAAALAISYAKRISADEAGIVHQAVLAATQGERNAD